MANLQLVTKLLETRLLKENDTSTESSFRLIQPPHLCSSICKTDFIHGLFQQLDLRISESGLPVPVFSVAEDKKLRMYSI